MKHLFKLWGGLKAMQIFVKFKGNENYSLNQYGNLKRVEAAFENGFFAPFEEIMVLLATIVGTGGVSAVLVEAIKRTSKSVKIKKTTFEDIEIDCVNCSIEEVKEILTMVNDKAEGK